MVAFVYQEVLSPQQYSDRGSGAKLDVSVFSLAYYPSYTEGGQKVSLAHSLGQKPIGAPADNANVLAVRFKKPDDVVPVGGGHEWWDKIWSNAPAQRALMYTVWKIKPGKIPNGYACLSPVFFKVDNARDPPTLAELKGMALVHRAYVTFRAPPTNGFMREVWNDRGTGAGTDLSLWTGPDQVGLFATIGYTAPNETIPLINKDLGWNLDDGPEVQTPSVNNAAPDEAAFKAKLVLDHQRPAPTFVFQEMLSPLQFSDKGSGAKADLSVFSLKNHPSYVENGQRVNLAHNFGQKPVGGKADSAAVIAVHFKKPDAVIPVGGGYGWWERVWTNEPAQRPLGYTVWRIKAAKIPNGYVSLSPCFYKVDTEREPPTDAELAGAVLVKKEYVVVHPPNGDVAPRMVWNDRGTGAKQDLSLWTGPDQIGLFASNGYTPPNEPFAVLNIDLGWSLANGPPPAEGSPAAAAPAPAPAPAPSPSPAPAPASPAPAPAPAVHTVSAEEAELRAKLALYESRGVTPERKAFVEFLESVQRLLHNENIKIACFISYAWNPDPASNKILQDRLQKLKEDLTTAGIAVKLDIQNMRGDISHYMAQNIQLSTHVLLMCTPRLKARVEEANPNNMKFELQHTLDKQAENPNFLVPLIFEAGFRESIPTRLDDKDISSTFRNILALDFSKTDHDFQDYVVKMASCSPLGLIPTLCCLENNKDYQRSFSALLMELGVIRNELQKFK